MIRRHSLPAEVYTLVEQTPASMLLEGKQPQPGESNEQPWTRLFTAPLRVCTAYTAAEIPELFRAIESAVAAGLSAAGFFSYECGNCFEPKSRMHASREDQPLAWFGIYEHVYVFDHESGTFLGADPPQLEHFQCQEHDAEAESAPEPEFEIDADFALTEAEYSDRVAAIHEWIRAGDVYQLNFTASMRIRTKGRPSAIYMRLRARQPVSYGAFLHWQDGRHILSFSPELFFRVDGEGGSRHIVTRPMKGTAARGRTTREDRAIAQWLSSDPKNRSENVMIVDLLRNDLGRLAEFGTVRAENLFAVERYPTLWQMTSTVSAILRPDIGFHDIFRALFPCGSVTGAPKVRAMQLLSELEGEPRGVYTGAIGFFSPQQTVFNVAIRTIELDGANGTMGVGSGIVIDSDPAAEFRECLLKAEFLTGPAHRAEDPMIAAQPDKLFLIETMLWNGGYPFLEFHLNRLTDSAEYFGFPCAREEVRAALAAHAHVFAASDQRKVRLLLDNQGTFQIGSETLAPGSAEQPSGRVRISEIRTDPTDRYFYHKTTHRPFYASAYKEAVTTGYDDVLFLNLRGEVTEGAISNIFIEKDGRWLTPPIDCGLLPGVYRRHLLETRPEIEERILTLDDLRAADAVYLANAVRGLRKVQIDWAHS